jgi:hypothetical protein
MAEDKTGLIADLKKANPITIIKVGLTLLILGIIVYFVIKYWKWFKVGAGLLAAAAAFPFLIDIVAGVIGTSVSAVAAIIGFFKKRIKDGATEEELKNTAETVKEQAKNTDPEAESTTLTGNNGQSIEANANESIEENEQKGEDLADSGATELESMES